MEISYQDFIQNILNTRGRFNCGDQYHERHHIIPKCMGGTNGEENLIDLFAREHFEAHKILSKEHPDNKSLVFAWTCMAFPNNAVQKRCAISPEEYEEARIVMSKAMSGRKMSDEAKKKLSENRKGKSLSPETKQKLSEALKGRTITDETRKKMSEASKGRVVTEETKEKFRKTIRERPRSEAQKEALARVCESNKGRHHTEESKAKISAGNKGKKLSQETKDKLSKTHQGKPGHNMIKIAQYNLTTNELIKIWDCIMDATKALGINNSSIAKCARGKYKSAGGFRWEFA